MRQRARHHRLGGGEELARGGVLGSELQKGDAAVHEGGGVVGKGPSGPRADVRIADRVQPGEHRCDQTASATGLVFRAPTSGRFYGRPSPDKAPFVSIGDELAPGTTICLLEVMKTFNRVTYGGSGLPERAKVREILVVEGADVTAGEPLLTLE